MISLVGLLVCFSAVLDAWASRPEEDYVVRVWDTRHGLPVDAVRAIAQTPDGYLWVGTFGGLARFDGNRFQVFDVGNTPELPNNLINALYCDRRGRLWIGHDGGQVSILEGHKVQRVSLPLDPLRISIRGFGEDAEGNIWVLNASWKLAVITPSGNVTSPPVLNLLGPVLHLDASAPDHRLRIITSQGQCFIANRKGFTPDPDSPPAPSDGRRVIRSASGGYWALHGTRLGRWVGGRMVEDAGEVDWGEAIFATTCEWNGMMAAGTFRQGLNLARRRDDYRRRFDDRTGLPSSWVAVLFADAAGTLWVGTGDGGLAAIWPKRVWMAIPPGEAARKHVQSVTPGVDVGIWAATEGAGLFNFNGVIWRQSPDMPGLSAPVYSSILMSHEGRLWAVSPGNGLSYLQDRNWHQMAGTSPITGSRGGLLLQGSSILWAGTTEGLIRFTGDNFTDVERMLANSGVSCLVEDGAGGIWFGGFGTGLCHWQSNQTQVLRAQDGVPSENLLSLCKTRDGSLWIGTDGAGLVRMKNGHFAVISKPHGLPSATICHMVEDAEGRLWMGTYRGICAVSVEELSACAEGRLEQVKCLALDTSDGMEIDECSAGTQPSVCRTADGRLWFATARGVAVVSPSSIKLNTHPPPVWIEWVKTDTGSVTLGQPEQSINLPRGQRRLQIAFTAPCLRAAHRVRFKHRLEPVESNWIDSIDSREATYTRVSPGNYTFRVIACNEDGVWNMTGAAVALTVPPFLWERAWFAPMCWAGGVGTVAAIVLVTMRRRLQHRLERMEQRRAVERERSRISKDLHDDLGGSLTEINMLAKAIKPDSLPTGLAAESVALIAQKSNRTVCALDEIVWAINPKHDSMASLADYLSGTSQEFLSAAGISLRLDMQRNLSAIPLSPEFRHDLFLAVKESLNNVVRHSQATEVWLRFKVEAGCLRIVVEDNGRGFDPAAAATGGDGLDNLRARLGGLGGTCRIVSRTGGGTAVELEVTVK